PELLPLPGKPAGVRHAPAVPRLEMDGVPDLLAGPAVAGGEDDGVEDAVAVEVGQGPRDGAEPRPLERGGEHAHVAVREGHLHGPPPLLAMPRGNEHDVHWTGQRRRRRGWRRRRWWRWGWRLEFELEGAHIDRRARLSREAGPALVGGQAE